MYQYLATWPKVRRRILTFRRALSLSSWAGDEVDEEEDLNGLGPCSWGRYVDFG